MLLPRPLAAPVTKAKVSSSGKPVKATAEETSRQETLAVTERANERVRSLFRPTMMVTRVRKRTVLSRELTVFAVVAMTVGQCLPCES